MTRRKVKDDPDETKAGQLLLGGVVVGKDTGRDAEEDQDADRGVRQALDSEDAGRAGMALQTSRGRGLLAVEGFDLRGAFREVG